MLTRAVTTISNINICCTIHKIYRLQYNLEVKILLNASKSERLWEVDIFRSFGGRTNLAFHR